MHLAVQRGGERRDHRVDAVLEVLGGARSALVAGRYGVEPVLLQRWVRTFLEGGTALVTNEPREDAARSRDRFLAAFAHELRTPLAVAQGWSALMEDPEVEAGDLELAVPRIAQALRRLHERVVDVELLASASLGRLQLERHRFAVAALLDGLGDALDGATLSAEDGAEIEVEGDLAMLQRVVRDLWGAAGLEPTPARRRIEVQRSRDWIELRIIRDAAPISPLQLQALFDPFETNADDTGITIGLYLARALVVAHRGTVGVEQDDQRGVFWVRLPAPGATVGPVPTEPTLGVTDDTGPEEK
jgi:signal transduction histidine kinase